MVRMKLFEDYIEGQIVNYKNHVYKVRLKRIRVHHIKMANLTVRTKILYLEAMDTNENRVAEITKRGTLEFIKHNRFKYKPTRGSGGTVYETWNEQTVSNMLKNDLLKV